MSGLCQVMVSSAQTKVIKSTELLLLFSNYGSQIIISLLAFSHAECGSEIMANENGIKLFLPSILESQILHPVVYHHDVYVSQFDTKVAIWMLSFRKAKA